MGKNSKIEWTNHTFNPWWGCTKVSEACKFCYAEAWAKRLGEDIWGSRAPRRFFSEEHWKAPLAWNRQAEIMGIRSRVFCASMADVFERRADLNEPREKLWSLIEATPHLDWLLLTKRPQLVNHYAPWKEWPKNVWMGTTVENQKCADIRLPELAEIPAAVRFISAEPLRSELDISRWLGGTINWVITGGESGPHARPSSPSWFRTLMTQCMEAEVPFHFKQWGDWAPGQGINLPAARKKASTAADGTVMIRIGKKLAGRTLDGSTWDGLPLGRAA